MVIADVPRFPSLVAVIVANPAVRPVTRPLPLTVAMPASLLVQVTTRPLNALPAGSCGVAVSCTVSPMCTLAEAGITATAVTGRWRMCTRDEPESVSAGLKALTRKSPDVVSAVKSPWGVMLPPVALQFTVTAALSPLALRP